MCSPENTLLTYVGPQGLTWDINADGKPQFTDYGLTVFPGGSMTNVAVPEEWGGGNFRDGSNNMESNIRYNMNIDPDFNEYYQPTMWDTTLASSRTLVNEQWTDVFGYDWPLQYDEAHDMLSVLPGTSYISPADSSDIATERSQCGTAIVAASWKMIFAKDEDEFNSLWDTLKKTLDGDGYQDVLAVDKANADDYVAAIKAVVANDANSTTTTAAAAN
jgi:multiple sugar transport system substrate-binding protein/putative aldouronate transport system substrate-binding protein